MMDEDLTAELDTQNSDDEPGTAAHNKLLGAVNRLYQKKRVGAVSRKEPSLEVSEFHLSRQQSGHKERIKVTELARSLNSRATYAQISQKLKTAQKKAKTLPKPLEQIHADRINRVAGYEHTKQQLNRWDAIVYQQRVADQLTFPLRSETVTLHQNTDIAKMFRKPTELELELSKLLKQPKPFAEKEEEILDSKNKTTEEDYPMNLAMVIEKRKMMAKLRARQSYKQAKAVRHSKIKSRKFHQIQRKARVKEQLKEFEELQQKDPEAALKKLEELERTRAEERATLRHSSTGQWAKNLTVRAKYDKEARIALAEQLAKGKELTVKLAQKEESESEKEEEQVYNDEFDMGEMPGDKNDDNQMIKQSKEMVDFVSGYRKYWEEKGNKMEVEDESDKVVRENNSQYSKEVPEIEISCMEKPRPENYSENNIGNVKNNTSNTCNHSGKKVQKSKNKNIFTVVEGFIESGVEIVANKAPSNFTVSNVTDKYAKNVDGSLKSKNGSNNIVANKSSSNFTVSNVTDKITKIGDSSQKSKKGSNNVIANKSLSNFIVSNVTDKIAEIVNSSPKSKEVSNNFNLKSNTGSCTVTKLINKKSLVKSQNTKNNEKIDRKLSGTYEVTETRHGRKKSMERSNKVNDTNKQTLNKKTDNKIKNLDEMFEEVEETLQNKIQEKVDRIRQQLNRQQKNVDEIEKESETNENPSLKMRKQNITADVDEELSEGFRLNGEQNRIESDTVVKTAAIASAEVKSGKYIDVQMYKEVIPRQLASGLPEIETEGDDALDQKELTAVDNQLTICEAFADQDIVEQFEKEKEEEAKKSAVEDVDLSLPGWGSWAGHNLKAAQRRTRKKFVIKFPRVIPRRDSNRGNVILNEDADKPIKEHQVSEVPFPFTSVTEYEASVRAPLGSTWVPQIAYQKLTQPAVVTKLGTIIPPMDEDQLVTVNKQQRLLKRKSQSSQKMNHLVKIKK